MSDGLSRREFIKLAATASAAASIPGCEPAARKLIPYVVPDENVIPGVPTYYATVCSECPAGCGLVAKVREGRVIKLDGNPADPMSAGSICARGQAGLQGLYNPDRLAHPMRREQDGTLAKISWNDSLAMLTSHLKSAAQAGDGRVAFIGPPQGPALTKIATAWLGAWRSNRAVYYEAISNEPARLAIQQCFGRDDLPIYHLDRAEFIISFGADFLETWNSPVEMTRQFATFCDQIARGAAAIGRSVYVGPRFGLTAAKSDDWIAPMPGTEALLAMAILNVVVANGWARAPGLDSAALRNFAAHYEPASVNARIGVAATTISGLARSFANSGAALAIAGTDDPATHVACFVLNAVTGNLGRTIAFAERGPAAPAAPFREMENLANSMREGAVDVLLVAGGNPIFSMPPAAGLVDAMRRVPFVVWCGGVPDETAGMAHLLLPVHHPLETWGDSFPRAGIYGFAQPVTDPVFESRPLGDILIDSIRAAGRAPAWNNTREAVEASFRELYAARGGAGAGFDDAWHRAKRNGGVFGDARVADVRLKPDALKPLPSKPPGQPDALHLVAFPHIFLYDGRGADKPWLQEIPEPISQFVWEHWAEIHADTARRLGIKRGDIIELSTEHGVIELPAYVSTRVHPGAIAVPIGQGHSAYGRYAKGRGANVWKLLPPGRTLTPVKVRKSGGYHELISILTNGDMLGRPIIEAIALDELARNIKPPKTEPEPPEPWEMYEQYKYPKHMWGMTIDTNACTGCSACVAACYAENNLPFVGKKTAEYGRIMSWIRIERYFPANEDAPPLYLAPMLCQQCDQAPCEPVCPVFAAYHTDEGLNGQIYNRCVGTRYCENNCPYKVRRFNWFDPEWPAPLHLQLNPDVTVRSAGVMEKCTFCIQRIVAAEIDAKIEKRPVRDGEIVPACAQACPAHVISFGDMNDTNSAMMRRRKDNAIRTYRALEELNTRPAIVYLRDIYRRRENE